MNTVDHAGTDTMPTDAGIEVLLIGTLDTKGPEIGFVASEIERQGARVCLLDSGTAGVPALPRPDVTRDEVAKAAGTSLAELGLSTSRGEALERMAEGVRVVTLELFAAGRIQGALCVGGAGVSLVVPAFQALPVGFPKVLVSPLASGRRTLEMFVGTRDVAVMHSVCDIVGVNALSEAVFRQAAGAVVGMARAMQGPRLSHSGRSIAATMNGNTTPAVMKIREAMAARGVELIVFHANGVGGRAMEALVDDGAVEGVLDFTTTELSGEEFGGMMGAGARRMEVAGRVGLPQVLVPGCIDMLTGGPYAETAARHPGKRLYRHNPALTLVRLDQDEMAHMGAVFARKALAARGPVRIVVPLGGLSIPDSPGGAFWDEAADAAFVGALIEGLDGRIPVDLVDAHINDDVFAERVTRHLDEALVESMAARTGALDADG